MDRAPANTASQAGHHPLRFWLSVAVSAAAFLEPPPADAQPQPLLVNPRGRDPAPERQWRLISLDEEPSPSWAPAIANTAMAKPAANPTGISTSTEPESLERPWRLVAPQAPSTSTYQLPAN